MNSQVNISKKLTVFISSCDAYEDVWDPFFNLFSFYWNDCRCEVVLCTETKHFSYPGLEIKCNPPKDKRFGKRILSNLEIVETDYILFMLEDFFLRKKVDEYELEKIISFLDENDDAPVVYLTGHDYANGENGICEIDQFAPYKLNCQAAVWRTDSFRKLWRDYDNPWRWEIFVNLTTFDSNDRFFSLQNGSVVDYGVNWEIAEPYWTGIYHGKWVLENVETLFLEHEIKVDYSKRGIYSPEEKYVNRLFGFDLIFYLFRRIHPKWVMGFIIYEVKKRLLFFGGRKKRFDSYAHYIYELKKGNVKWKY